MASEALCVFGGSPKLIALEVYASASSEYLLSKATEQNFETGRQEEPPNILDMLKTHYSQLKTSS